MKLRTIVPLNGFLTSVAFFLGVVSTLAIQSVTERRFGSSDFVLTNPWDTSLKQKLVGRWAFDDLRTENIEQHEIIFTSDGHVFDDLNSKRYATRWFTNRGVLYFAADSLNGKQRVGSDYVWPVELDFLNGDHEFTITLQGKTPQGRLTRLPNS